MCYISSMLNKTSKGNEMIKIDSIHINSGESKQVLFNPAHISIVEEGDNYKGVKSIITLNKANGNKQILSSLTIDQINNILKGK